jgi:hypothetical protein
MIRVTALDLCHNRATISHGGGALEVDTCLLDPQTMPLRLSVWRGKGTLCWSAEPAQTLVQIIGEMASDGSLLLRARVCRVVDGDHLEWLLRGLWVMVPSGLNMALYEKALALQRTFLDGLNGANPH